LTVHTLFSSSSNFSAATFSYLIGGDDADLFEKPADAGVCEITFDDTW